MSVGIAFVCVLGQASFTNLHMLLDSTCELLWLCMCWCSQLYF